MFKNYFQYYSNLINTIYNYLPIQNFENILTKKYLESPPNLILENESRNIGGATLPGKFYDKIDRIFLGLDDK